MFFWNLKYYFYSAKSNLLTVKADGLLLNQTQFTWTGRQLSSLQNNGNMVNYTYNSDGIRTSKIVNGIKTTYQLDGTKIVSETTNGNIKWYIYDENNLIIGFEYNDQAYYFEKNAQGDVVRIFDSDGNFVSEYFYDAWGNIVSISGNQEIANANSFRYRGYYYDNESGLYYLQSRYYDIFTGRFLNADSGEVLILGELNLFAYCDNNPVNRIDFNGYWYYTLSKYFDIAVKSWQLDPRCVSMLEKYVKISNNYSKNKKLWNGYNYFINGQGRGNIGKMVLGSSKVADVGCEAIAIYNAMKRKGKSVTLYIILSEIEMNELTWFNLGGCLGGCLGVNPKDIYKYLNAHKMSYKKYTSFSSFEKAAKDKKKTCIVGFKLKDSIFKVHTVALYWNGSKWIVYNRFNNSKGTESYSKLSDLTSSKKFIVGYVM